jgi:type II secretory ATPase GspE/PulE/Tfp pilus assembly ATPase PilB-like protein
MITIDDFNLSDSVRLMLTDNNLLSQDDLSLNLEVYKFISRGELLSVLHEKYPDLNLKDLGSIERRKTDADREEQFAQLEKRFNVLVEYPDPITVRVITSTSNKLDEEKLSLSIPTTKWELIHVTPVNFLELTNQPYKDWNHIILFNRLILECVSRRATDIHFTIKHINKIPNYMVELRVDNDMVPCDLFAFNKQMNKDVIHKLVHHKSSAFVGDLETIFGVTASVTDILGDGDLSLRVSAMKVYGGYHCVCRLQSMSTVSMKASELGFSEEIVKDLLETSEKIGGLSLLTGGIRTGKNTTAFAIANEMLDKPIKIIDYSSPIEVLMPFTQVDYMADTKHLVQCVNLAKKQDVNVVFVNEIPNSEVAKSVVDLINSSVHVVTTTHLNRIWHLPHKLYEYFGDMYKNIFTQLNICVNQRMFSRQCPHCKNQAPVSNLPTNQRRVLEEYGVTYHFVNRGCEKCKEGKLIGGIQPYVERLVFTGDVVSELLKLNAPFEMELLIKEVVTKKKQSLEYELCNAIRKGNLSAVSLKSIL